MKHVWYLIIIILGVSVWYEQYLHVPENEIQGVKELDTQELRITFLDIGQGDATYLDFGNGEDMLIDCAIDGRILEALGRTMKWRDMVIDYLVVTHPDLDHYGGCEEVLRKFEVKNVIYNGLRKEDSKLWQSFWEATHAEGLNYREITAPERMSIASTTIEFLYPVHSIAENSKIPGHSKDTGSNNTSIIAKVLHGRTSILLMGDAENELEQFILEEYGNELDVDVLKLGHHGSDSSSGQDFLETVSPVDSVASVGKENKYGHPSRRVLKRLERVGSKVWRTDMDGDVVVMIDQNGYEIGTTKH